LHVMTVRRELTAIRRKSLSLPLQLALQYQWLKPEHAVLDYGCGRGSDVRLLQDLGYYAVGYDSYYAPEHPQGQFDFVNLGYVLNVIPDLDEREATLLDAYEKTTHGLLVTVRTGAPIKGTPFADGVLTSIGTFQHLFEVDETKTYIETVLDTQKFVMTTIDKHGICAFIVKDDDADIGWTRA